MYKLVWGEIREEIHMFFIQVIWMPVKFPCEVKLDIWKRTDIAVAKYEERPKGNQ